VFEVSQWIVVLVPRIFDVVLAILERHSAVVETGTPQLLGHRSGIQSLQDPRSEES
jgi:hypothetical protein